MNQNVGMDILPDLFESDLERIGVVKIGDIKRIRKYVSKVYISCITFFSFSIPLFRNSIVTALQIVKTKEKESTAVAGPSHEVSTLYSCIFLNSFMTC